MKRLPLILAGVLTVVGMLSVCLAGETVDVDSGNPPFMYQTPNGAAGIYPALIREAFKRIGEDVTIETLPWRRALISIDTGEAGIGGIYKTAERQGKYDFSDKLFEERVNLYVPRGQGFSYQGLASLKGKTVGVIRGWSYGDDFDAAAKAGLFQVQEVSGDLQNFEKLINGRVDVVLAIREAANVMLAAPELQEKVEVLSTPLMIKPTFVAFNKSAHKADLIARLNRAIAAMHADGSYDKIVSGTWTGDKN